MPKEYADVLAIFGESSFRSLSPGEDGSRILQPNVVTAEQYFPSPAHTPYHRLLLAVLEDAIICFQRTLGATNRCRQRLLRETEEWLFDSDGTAFMSCEMVCESLGINAALLRKHLRQWQARTQQDRDTRFDKSRFRLRRHA
jgi:hypothetical protein